MNINFEYCNTDDVTLTRIRKKNKIVHKDQNFLSMI